MLSAPLRLTIVRLVLRGPAPCVCEKLYGRPSLFSKMGGLTSTQRQLSFEFCLFCNARSWGDLLFPPTVSRSTSGTGDSRVRVRGLALAPEVLSRRSRWRIDIVIDCAVTREF